MFTARRSSICLLAAAALLASGSSLWAADDIRVIKEVSYGETAEGKFHQLDLYLPKTSNFPVVVFAHGGAWMSGDKSAYEFFGKYLSEHGIGAVVVNYRLSPKIKHPGHVEDVAKAVAWTQANISKHGGNRDQLFLCGYSAGGHLVSLLGTDPRFLKAEGLSRDAIRGIVSISGVYSQEDLPALDLIFPAKDRHLSFPLKHVSAAGPAFLLFHAKVESFGLDKQARRFQAELYNVGKATELHEIEGTTHLSIATETVLRQEYGTRIVEFVFGTHTHKNQECSCDHQIQTRESTWLRISRVQIWSKPPRACWIVCAPAPTRRAGID